MPFARASLPRLLPLLALAAALLLSLLIPVDASSHREAPLLLDDPLVDNTDVYAFVSPDRPDTVTLIANWIPLELPSGGPNYFKFADGVRYLIHVDNNGDAMDDVSYEFTFTTQIQNEGTFLYNTGPIESLDDENFNIRQVYGVTRIRGDQREELASGLATPPVNIGPRSTPNYDALAAAAVHDLPGGGKVFAGQRDDAFFVDLGSAFDLLGLRPLNQAHLVPLPEESGVDSVAGFNTHTIAIQVPKTELVAGDPVVGVYSTTERPGMKVFSPTGAAPQQSGEFVQVSRLGMPLVNEVVIPLGMKDEFNASEPSGDQQFLQFVQDPEPARLLPVLYPVFTQPGMCLPTAPRMDLVTIFLTGIEGLNQPQNVTPSEMIRLNTEIAPTPLAQQDRLGLLAGQMDGFPNGRRLVDDTVDIELQALAGATPLGACADRAPNNALSDGVDGNDLPLLPAFPYLATPHQGYELNEVVSIAGSGVRGVQGSAGNNSRRTPTGGLSAGAGGSAAPGGLAALGPFVLGLLTAGAAFGALTLTRRRRTTQDRAA
jgi:hypothetical protein